MIDAPSFAIILFINSTIWAAWLITSSLRKAKQEKANSLGDQLASFRYNPIAKLPFEALISGDEANAAKIEAHAKEQIIEASKQHGVDASNILAQIGASVAQKGTYIARFSGEIQAGLKNGSLTLMNDKSGQNLLTAVTEHGKQIAGNARELSVGPKTAAAAASITAIVISAAHIISGYDNAKRLRSIDRKVGRIARAQETAMVGKLEAIYESLQEELTNRDATEKIFLRQLKLNLKELRSAWFRQIEGALEEIEDPNNRGTLKKYFSRTLGLDKGVAQKIANETSQQEINIYLIRIAIFLEEVIATVLDEHEVYNQMTVPGIMGRLSRLEELLVERKDFIAKLIDEPKERVESQIKLIQNLRGSLTNNAERSTKQISA